MGERWRTAIVGACMITGVGIAVRQIAGQSNSDSAFEDFIAALSRPATRSPRLVAPTMLRRFSTPQVESLIYREDRYMRAAAIAVLKERRDRRPYDFVAGLFTSTVIPEHDLAFDPHLIPSPELSVWLASTEYLAVMDGARFGEVLASRREIWRSPHLFTGIMRSMGPGWIHGIVMAARQPHREASAAFLIGTGASIDNAVEVAELLRGERGLIWRGAVHACERIQTDDCWRSLDANLRVQAPGDQLMARDIQVRSKRASISEWFSAAENTAIHARGEVDPEAQTRDFMDLYEFIAHARTKRVKLPEPLSRLLVMTGSRAIAEALADVTP